MARPWLWLKAGQTANNRSLGDSTRLARALWLWLKALGPGTSGKKTEGAWVAEGLARALRSLPASCCLLALVPEPEPWRRAVAASAAPCRRCRASQFKANGGARRCTRAKAPGWGGPFDHNAAPAPRPPHVLPAEAVAVGDVEGGVGAGGGGGAVQQAVRQQARVTHVHQRLPSGGAAQEPAQGGGPGVARWVGWAGVGLAGVSLVRRAAAGRGADHVGPCHMIGSGCRHDGAANGRQGFGGCGQQYTQQACTLGAGLALC